MTLGNSLIVNKIKNWRIGDTYLDKEHKLIVFDIEANKRSEIIRKTIDKIELANSDIDRYCKTFIDKRPEIDPKNFDKTINKFNKAI